jgi:hypothetical protein
LLKQGLKAVGQSLLIVTGVGYGVIKALELFETATPPGAPEAIRDEPIAHEPIAQKPIDLTLQRLDGMEERLIRMEKSLEVLTAPRPEKSRPETQVTKTPVPETQIPEIPIKETQTKETPGPEASGKADFVTREEMNAALERLTGAVDSNIERRFEVQNRSVQSLRTMVARTDELLEQVLESIEANSIPA